VEKHIYHHRAPRRVEKHIYHHRAPRRVEKRVYHHYQAAPRQRVVKKIIVENHRRHNNALPVIAGGLIGSAIGHDVGHGDPLSTFSGAVFGAMLGDALSHH
jgi:outer membrane lipoprotein SlyB